MAVSVLLDVAWLGASLIADCGVGADRMPYGSVESPGHGGSSCKLVTSFLSLVHAYGGGKVL